MSSHPVQLRARSVLWVVPLVAMAALLVWGPKIVGAVFGYSPTPPTMVFVLTVVAAVLLARVLTWRFSPLIRSAACLGAGVVVHVFWAYPATTVEEFSWFLVWSIFSGTIWVVGLGSILVGVLPLPKPGRG